MAQLIDDEEYNNIYFSDKISPTIYPKKFDFDKYINDCGGYIQNLNVEFRKLIHHLLLHYLSISEKICGENFDEHIPSFMYNLLNDCKIPLTCYTEYEWSYYTLKNCLKMIDKPGRYECENAHYYIEITKSRGFYDIDNRFVFYTTSNPKPKKLRQLAAEAYINSEQWIYTSILDFIEYNFKDLVFGYDKIESIFDHYNYTFYNILLIKFIFQYFLKRNDTIFPTFRLICKCTYGLKSMKHVNDDTSKYNCKLCNAYREHFYFEEICLNLVEKNKTICLCDD